MKPNTNNNPPEPDETPPAEGEALKTLRAENERLKASIRTATAQRNITGELAKAGARSPDLLFDSVKGDLQFDDEGNPVNAAALLSSLKQKHPEQFGFEKPTATGSIDAGAAGRLNPSISKDALRRMKPNEIAKLDWDEVKRVLSK